MKVKIKASESEKSGKYTVGFGVSGNFSITVDADSIDDAIDKAEYKVNRTGIQSDTLDLDTPIAFRVVTPDDDIEYL